MTFEAHLKRTARAQTRESSVRERHEVAAVEIGLNAAILAVQKDEPVVLVVRSQDETGQVIEALPFGPFSPLEHRTLEIGLRKWVSEQTGLELGYVEQLYTFGDRGRHAQPGDVGPHVVSIGYLALTRPAKVGKSERWDWRSWYDYFPWEDWRRGKPAILTEVIEPKLTTWAERPPVTPPPPGRPAQRSERLRMFFGLFGGTWDEEKVLERFELLYEAGLVEEARRDGREAAATWDSLPRLGVPMRYDHRRILATAIGRIRAKIKYRPVVFELMPDEFTLFELQKTVEAILGPHLHKQNFRRLVESAGLVEPTGEVRAKTGGRPARLYRFRREVLLERPAPGVRVKPGRN
ncbi:MAG TPA: NAD regulator [Hyphomicrobiaceae bacterium]|nr:NAD regulator [Hyphomicrobiaceae bacterium]